MAIKLRCSSCRGAFTWATKKVFPRHCPLCGAYCGVDDRPEVASPLIGQAKHKAPDMSYRELESSTQARAQQAADMLGVPVSEMSDMKVTDMKDTNQKQGDLQFAPQTVSKEFAQAMEQSPGVGMVSPQMDQQTVQHINMARAGSGPGKAAMGMIGDHFHKNRHAVVASGTEGRFGKARGAA